MRAAGIRIVGGRAVWVDAGEHVVSPMDRVTVRLLDGVASGSIFASPEQLLQPPSSIEGTIVAVHPLETEEDECRDLPGADMPPLGSTIQSPVAGGMVTAVDAVKRMVTVRTAEGAEVTLAADGAELRW